MEAGKPRSSYSLPEWPGHRCNNDDERNEIVPKCSFVFSKVKNIFFRLRTADSDKCNSKDHSYRVLYPIKSIENIFHHLYSLRRIRADHSIASHQPLV